MRIAGGSAGIPPFLPAAPIAPNERYDTGDQRD
jgi:hypothetical protein